MLISYLPLLFHGSGTDATGPSMSHDIFICYSSRDKTVADAVCAVMEAEGVRCWIAPRDILPGADWGESIIDAINEARAMVLIFSSNANEAQSQIKREVERAVNKGLPVIPFRIENVLPTKALEYFLSTPHWLDAFTPPLDGHIRQLADSTKRLLGRPLSERPPLTSAAPPFAMPNLAHQVEPLDLKIDFKKITIAGKPPLEWVKEPKHAAIAGALALFLLGILGYEFRPTPKPEDQQAWNQAAMQDTIPAYQLYTREMPSGYYLSKADTRIGEIRTLVENAFAKAKAAGTQAAYQSFLQNYSQQGLDMDEAREGMINAGQQEAGMRMAYQRAISTRSRAGYQGFLSQYGSSSFAGDVRQRLAACHSETRNTSSNQNSQVEKDGTGQASNPTAACNQARTDAITRISQTCNEEQARLGPTQVLNQNVENAPSSTAGQAVGSVLGSTLFGGRNVNIPTSYECTVSVGGTCEKQVSGAQSVDVCP